MQIYIRSAERATGQNVVGSCRDFQLCDPVAAGAAVALEEVYLGVHAPTDKDQSENKKQSEPSGGKADGEVGLLAANIFKKVEASVLALWKRVSWRYGSARRKCYNCNWWFSSLLHSHPRFPREKGPCHQVSKDLVPRPS